MENQIVTSKLRPPLYAADLIPRNVLADRLKEYKKPRLIVLHAGAGYGKTSSLALWQDSLIAKRVPAAWLTLDDYDQEISQFVSYFIAACVDAGFNQKVSEVGLSHTPASVSIASYGASLANALERCKGEHVVILDDFHRAESKEVSGLLQYLVNFAPPQILFVVSARQAPVLTVADLKLRAEVLELTQADLQFTKGEVQDYLDNPNLADVSVDWCEGVYERTEGWPVALQMVRRWMQDGIPPEQILTQLSGRAEDIAAYFFEQVFDSLSDEAREFLLKTSILERVNGDVGNVICGNSDGWEVLQALDQKDVFVQSLDLERSWYRHHRLFSEFLHSRLQRSGFDLMELHIKAAKWFGSNGYAAEAIQHALSANDEGVCAEMLESLGGWQYIVQGHILVVERVLEKLSFDTIRQYPRVWLAQIFYESRLGKVTHARQSMQHFSDAMADYHQSDETIICDATIVRALLNRYADDRGCEEDIRSLEDLDFALRESSHTLLAVRDNVLCYLYREVDRFDDSLRAGDSAISHFRAFGSVWGEAFVYFHEGNTCLQQARVRDAEALYQEGYRLAIEAMGEDSDLVAIASAFLAETSYLVNKPHEAELYLQRALPHIEYADAWIDVYIAAYITQLRLLASKEDWDNYRIALSRARKTSMSRRLPRLSTIIDVLDSELSGATETATIEVDDGLVDHLALQSRAQQYYKHSQYGEICEMLEAHCADLRRDRHVLRWIEQSILLAGAYLGLDQKRRAVDTFQQVVSTALFESIKRPFIAQGMIVRELIRLLTGQTTKRLGNRLRDAFIAELVSEIGAQDHDKSREEHLLSPREREVLRYLMQGHSNREIASVIGVSVNTIKFHLKNLFEKLGVTSREDAVTSAIQQKLV